jgi:hypothetical protein
VVTDRDYVIRKSAGHTLLPSDEPRKRSPSARSEATGEELRHQIMKVEDDRNALELRDSGAEHKEVRQVVDLDRLIWVTKVESRQPSRGKYQEVQVAEKLAADATLAETNGQPMYRHTSVPLSGSLPRPPQADDVDRVSGIHEHLGLALDPRFGKRVVGMNDHAMT